MGTIQPILWDNIRLVVFDVDGTLYDQRRLRIHMAQRLLSNAVQSGTLNTLRVLHAFRKCREELGARLCKDFTSRQFEETARRTGCTVKSVKVIVSEWIDERPLEYMQACRYHGVEDLFDRLHQSGRVIGIFSDYPAKDKLAALELNADVIVSATDQDVDRLKPDPAGLLKILKTTGVSTSQALMVGDRFDRDWAVANSIGMPAIIRSRRKDPRCATFRTYADPLFKPLKFQAHGTATWQNEGHASQF
jgi:HAD superfamily hydrolase (TIGR01549 family)